MIAVAVGKRGIAFRTSAAKFEAPQDERQD